MHQSATNWVAFLAFLSPFCVLIFAIREGWKLIDEVNVAVRGKEHYRHWGSDPVQAWTKHETLFPERASVRRRVRWLYLASMGLMAAVVLWQILR